MAARVHATLSPASLRGALLAVLLAAGAAGTARAGEPPAPALEISASDIVHATAVVPDPVRRLGRVRLLSRGDAVVVQTLLATRLLRRAAAEIRLKEEANWPGGEASAYLGALDEVVSALEERPLPAGTRDRRRRLLIEFAADATSTAVLLGTFVDGEDDDGSPGREVLRRLRPERAWVLRNIRLILADAFDRDANAIDDLGPLGPAAAGKLP